MYSINQKSKPYIKGFRLAVHLQCMCDIFRVYHIYLQGTACHTLVGRDGIA